MTGLEEFLALFGDITLSKIITFIFAAIFLFSFYKQVKKYVNSKIKEQQDKKEEEKNYKEKINKSYDYVQGHQNEYKAIESKVQKIEGDESGIMDELKKISNRIEKMENDMRRREKNQLRDLLIKYYRHYTNKKLNPGQTWTNMEKQAFNALLEDYEEAGGNDYIHTVVKPAMELLLTVDIDTLCNDET